MADDGEGGVDLISRLAFRLITKHVFVSFRFCVALTVVSLVYPKITIVKQRRPLPGTGQ